MKKVLVILLVLLTLFGCGSSKNYGELLVGTFSWTSSKGEEIIMSFDGENYYTLNEDVALTMVPYELDGNNLNFEGEQYQVDFNKNNDLLLTLDPEYEPVEMKRMSDTYLLEQFNKIPNIKRKLVGYWKFTVNDTEYYFNFDEGLSYVYLAAEGVNWIKGYYFFGVESATSIELNIFDYDIDFHLNEVLECDFIDINHVKMGPFELTRIHESEVKI